MATIVFVIFAAKNPCKQVPNIQVTIKPGLNLECCEFTLLYYGLSISTHWGIPPMKLHEINQTNTLWKPHLSIFLINHATVLAQVNWKGNGTEKPSKCPQKSII